MEYYSYFEIHKSYEQMKQSVDEVIRRKDAIEKVFEDISEIIFLGCGSSYWLSLSASRTFSKLSKKHSLALKATEVSMHLEEMKDRFKRPLFITPTRSGASKELLISMEYLKKVYPQAKILTLSEYQDNQMAAMSDLNIALPWADETSICQTRSFNCLYISLLAIAGQLWSEKLLDEVMDYLAMCETLYPDIEAKTKKIVNQMCDPEIVVLGSGPAYGCVIEGAYIVEEMAQHIATYYHTLEYRHGPIVCANKNTYLFLCHTSLNNEQLEIDMAAETKHKGATIICCGFDDEKQVADWNFILKGDFGEEIRGIYFTAILQSIAYYLAVASGYNPDQPQELVKYITY